MGRESHEFPTQVVHSSIALLQERFRELQRVKEMREEKELLRMLSEPNNTTYKQFNMKSLTLTSQPQYYEPAKLFFQTDLVPQQTPSPQVSLSLWPTFQNSFEEQYHYLSGSFNESPLWMKSWPMIVNSPSFQPSANNKSQDYVGHEADVDTSLHL